MPNLKPMPIPYGQIEPFLVSAKLLDLFEILCQYQIQRQEEHLRLTENHDAPVNDNDQHSREIIYTLKNSVNRLRALTPKAGQCEIVYGSVKDHGVALCIPKEWDPQATLMLLGCQHFLETGKTDRPETLEELLYNHQAKNVVHHAVMPDPRPASQLYWVCRIIQPSQPYDLQMAWLTDEEAEEIGSNSNIIWMDQWQPITSNYGYWSKYAP